MGLIPKQTKAENKLKWGLTLNRMIGLMITVCVSTLFANLVHQKIKIPFMIVCVVIFLFSQSKAPTHPRKTFIQGLKSFYSYIFTPKKYAGVNCAEYSDIIEKEEERASEKQRKKHSKK